MQILVVALLSREVEAEVRRISFKYQPQLYEGKELPPHITLMPPADLIGKLADVEQALDQVVKNQPDFAITIRGVDYFTRRNNVVYFQVELLTQLEDLQKTVVKSLSSLIQLDSYKKSSFRPHITLAKKMDSDRLQQILKELKDYQPKFTFPFQELGLFMLDERERFWQLRKKFALDHNL